MEDNKAPALLIFKDYGDEFLKLSQLEAGELLQAIAKFAIGEQVDKDKLSRIVSILFSLIEKDAIRNEQSYLQKLNKNTEYQRKYRSKQRQNQPEEGTTEQEDKEEIKAKGIPKKVAKGEKTAKNDEIQHHLNNKQALFFQSFKEHCPGKPIDCQISEMPAVDYDALMLAIKQSPNFLMKADNLSLKWCLEHANEIIAGKWKQYEDNKKQSNFTQREYNKDELNELFQSVDEIEF